MLGSLQTQFLSLRESLTPLLLSSKFKETGRLTPDEFVLAGDYLCYKFPTWTWEAGDASKRRDYLPQDKQYLVQRSVPCLRRVSQLAYNNTAGADEDSETMLSFALEAEAEGGEGDEEWVATHTAAGQPPSTRTQTQEMGDIPDLDSASPSSTAEIAGQMAATSLSAKEDKDEDKMPDMDDIPDMSDDEEDGMGGSKLVEEEDEAALKPSVPAPGNDSSNLLSVRTYDCSITYDKYYQTPRMWLLGYDENRLPLPPTTALSDVSSSHAHKTVTIEPFPHSSSLSMASVHPCKHAGVMARVVERMDGAVRAAQRQERERAQGGAGAEGKEGGKKDDGAGGKEKSKGKWGLPSLGGKKSKEGKDEGAASNVEGEQQQEVEGLRVDQYLVVFLKFMSSIVPTIEVDATNSI